MKTVGKSDKFTINDVIKKTRGRVVFTNLIK